VFEDSRIYSFEELFVTNPTANAKFLPNESEDALELSFDFLNKNDGVIVEILHDCVDVEKIKVNGTIISHGNVKTLENSKINQRSFGRRDLFSYVVKVMVLTASFMAFYMMGRGLLFMDEIGNSSLISRIMTILIVAVSLLLTFFLRTSHERMPKKLGNFSVKRESSEKNDEDNKESPRQ